MGGISNANDNEAIVQSVSNDKTEITLLLPRGGLIKAKNEGFETGDHVCFLLDSSQKKITKVLPKLFADLTVAVGSDPITRAALQEAPDPEELYMDGIEFEKEDETLKVTEEGHEDRSEEEEGKYSFLPSSDSE
jgi:hypothetical protein